MKIVAKGLKALYTPNAANLEECRELGKLIAKKSVSE
jgi:flavorubredoxin